MRWWSTKHNNDTHKLVLQSTPIFVRWSLWKNRYTCKYGRKTPNSSKVKYTIFIDTIFLLTTTFPYITWPSNWRSLRYMLEGYIHDLKVIRVCWQKPESKFVKLNIDSSALNSLGSICVDGNCRNHLGDLLFAYSSPMDIGTNNQAELEAACFCLCWCLYLGYRKVLLEMDSEISMNWIKLQTQTSWTNSELINKIYNIIIQFHDFKCYHTCREANFVADYLSKHSHTISSLRLFFTDLELPREAKAYFELHKSGMESFRRRKLKRMKNLLEIF